MFQIITTKGRKSADTLEALAAWLQEMQPSSVRIVWGDIEAEVECSDDAEVIVDELRRALRMEEAGRLDLKVQNENIYIRAVDAKPAAYIRFDEGCATLVCGAKSRPMADDESIESLFVPVSHAEIAALRTEAANAGDSEMVEICDRATGDDPEAIATCMDRMQATIDGGDDIRIVAWVD